ncbi:MAG: PIN domain-containing protein [Pseudonocardia sp.]
MNTRVVLDAAAFDVIDTARGQALRGLLRRASERDAEVCCAAVTLAEVCRDLARTRRVEACLARSRGGRRIRVVPTDERLAKLVGAILHNTRSGSEMLGDAHVVAVCTGADTAVVVTSDPDDVTRLGAAVPGVRIVTRAP